MPTVSGRPGRARGVAIYAVVGTLAASIACGKSTTPGAPATRQLQSVSVEPGTATLAAGLDQQFTATAHYDDGTTSPLTGGVTWSSSKASVATVDGAGLAHGVAIGGGVTITATHTSGVAGTAAISVTAAVLRSITVAPPAVTVAKGADSQFTATGHYTDGTSAALSGLTWSSSSSAVATVDTVGLASCQASSPVAVTITATDPATRIAGTASLSVVEPTVQLITVTPPLASIAKGFSTPFAFAVSGFYSDGTTRPIPPAEVTFSSSDGAVATLNADGVAHGNGLGAATITATYAANGTTYSALAQLKVTPPPGQITDVLPPRVTGIVVDPAAPTLLHVTGLANHTEYLVRLTPADENVLVQVHASANFDFPVCTAYAGTIPCRGADTGFSNELFVRISGTGSAAATYTLDVTPLPVLAAGDPATPAAVDTTETYFKVTGFPAGTFQASISGLSDRAELFVYDGPHGPFGSAQLCASLVGTSPTESCSGSLPSSSSSSAVYVTVAGWLTSAGTPFTLAVGP